MTWILVSFSGEASKRSANSRVVVYYRPIFLITLLKAGRGDNVWKRVDGKAHFVMEGFLLRSRRGLTLDSSRNRTSSQYPYGRYPVNQALVISRVAHEDAPGLVDT